MKGESEGDFGGSDRAVGVSRIVGCCAREGRGALTWDGLVERWQMYVIYIYIKKIELEKSPLKIKCKSCFGEAGFLKMYPSNVYIFTFFNAAVVDISVAHIAVIPPQKKRGLCFFISKQ